MSANTSPIFTLTPHVSYVFTSVTANTAMDGTGTVATALTGATNGTRIEKVIIQHLGSQGSANVVRFFINNGSTNATATNNTLVHEETLADNSVSQTAASVSVTWNCDIIIPSGYKLNVVIGTTVTSGYQVTTIGGDF